MDRLTSAFLGTVEENKDPERLGRLKVRVPSVFGVSEVGTDNIPWAIPFGLPAGGSKDSGGISFLPEVGDQVFILFLDGEPEKPCWAWCMQSVKQAEAYKFRSYNDTTKAPDAMRITRYGHTIEFSSGSVIVTNSQGYSLILQNGVTPNNGYLQLRTPRGQLISMDDELQLAQLFFQRDAQIDVGRDLDIRTAELFVRAMKGVYADVTKSCEIDAGAEILLTSGDGTSVTAGKDISLEAGVDVSANAAANILLNAGGNATITGAADVTVNGTTLNANATTIAVKATTVTVEATTIVLKAGGRTLTISSAGFDFS